MSTTTTRRTRTAARNAGKVQTPKPTAPKAAKPAAPKADEAKSKDFAALAKNDPTELHQAFVVWVKEQTGVDVDPKSVQLAFAFRHDFQRSDANQADLAKRRAEAEAAKVAKDAKRKAAAAKALAGLSQEDLKALLASAK